MPSPNKRKENDNHDNREDPSKDDSDNNNDEFVSIDKLIIQGG